MWAIALMNERVTREERLQSPGEEIANSLSAGAGLIAAIAGIPLLLVSQPNGVAIGLLQARWSSLRRPCGCISHLRSITRCQIGRAHV